MSAYLLERARHGSSFEFSYNVRTKYCTCSITCQSCQMSFKLAQATIECGKLHATTSFLTNRGVAYALYPEDSPKYSTVQIKPSQQQQYNCTNNTTTAKEEHPAQTPTDTTMPFTFFAALCPARTSPGSSSSSEAPSQSSRTRSDNAASTTTTSRKAHSKKPQTMMTEEMVIRQVRNRSRHGRGRRRNHQLF